VLVDHQVVTLVRVAPGPAVLRPGGVAPCPDTAPHLRSSGGRPARRVTIPGGPAASLRPSGPSGTEGA